MRDAARAIAFVNAAVAEQATGGRVATIAFPESDRLLPWACAGDAYGDLSVAMATGASPCLWDKGDDRRRVDRRPALLCSVKDLFRIRRTHHRG